MGIGTADFGYFSMSRHGSGESDREYLEWHQLDHMPEQWQVRGIAWGQRWASTPRCRAARAASTDEWSQVSHVVNYLMREPIEGTLDEFFSLAQRLRDMGRFPFMLPSLFQGALRLFETHAAPRTQISPDVVPFRPNRGIYLILEEPAGPTGWDAYQQRLHAEFLPELVTVPGVAGAWVYGTAPGLQEREIYTPGRFRVTVCYLDDDPADVGERIAEPLQRVWEDASTRPLLAAPFESMVEWVWDRF
jgi:hypothetical protein